MDAFASLAEPTRRRILHELRRAPKSVNQLALALDTTQPAMSKHLKVLREGGFVSRRGSAQRRIYQLEAAPFQVIEAWLEPYRQLWNRHLDALERHLDQQEHAHHEQETVSAVPARRRQRPKRR